MSDPVFRKKPLRILFEITHPKHAHLFKHAIIKLIHRGNFVAITARDKDVTLNLLDSWGFEYKVLSIQSRRGITRLLWECLLRDWRLIRFVHCFRPDIIVARVGPSAAHAGKLLKKPVLVFEDTEDGLLQQYISFPFVEQICTARHYEKSWGPKHIRYDSFDELAYLHPKRFFPRKDIVRRYGLVPGNYIIVRFVSWKAAHDIGQAGIPVDKRLYLLERLMTHGRVIVISEDRLPKEFERFLLPVEPDDFHHLLSNSMLTFGESSTVCIEGALLGIPGILINTMNWGSVNRLANHYKMVFQTHSIDEGLYIAENLLLDKNTPSIWRARRESLLRRETDLTDWMVDRIERLAIKKPTKSTPA